MGMIGAVAPDAAEGIGRAMTGYLHGLPEELYALFGTGYLGYAAMRQWGQGEGGGAVGSAASAPTPVIPALNRDPPSFNRGRE